MLKKEQHKWLKQLSDLSYPTPFKVTDLNKVIENAQLLKNHLPRIDFYYAIKSNSDKEVIQAVNGHVSGYDIASLGEFKILKDAGIDSKRILYSNPVKIPSHIKKTNESGVNHYAFDSLDEIKKISKNAPGANVYLRVKVSDYGSKFPLSKKFGVDPLHAVAYMDTAIDAGLKANGLTFHVGSQSENTHTWQRAFETSGNIIKNLARVGIKIDFLNIGGGFPVTYTERISTLRQLSKVINSSMDKHIPDDVRILAEPGRFISADASVIVTEVIAREHRGSNEWLFLDMGVFQGLMESLEMNNWKYPIFTKHGSKASNFSQMFALTGPTCDAYDTIGFDYALPSTIKTGDKLYIGVAGAYTSVYASNFNGFDPPKEYYLK